MQQHRHRLSVFAVIAGTSLLASTLSGHAADPTDIAAMSTLQTRGWTETQGGRGGKVIRITSLAAEGPGSLREALETPGPRIVVFEVGGIVDLGKRSLAISEPHVTIAGQTAPSPGITLIRGGVNVTTHDVIIQHIRIRPGEAGAAKMSGWEVDGLSTGGGARDVIIDHCSFSWATDENLSASGPQFKGAEITEWRENTSHRITFSNNLIAEGLAESTHSKGEHSKGTLVHDNAADILIVNNLYAHNMERSPLFKGGARGAVVNNLIYDPGPRAVHYNLIAEEWKKNPHEVGRLVLIGNVLRAGPSTPPDLAFFMIGGSGNLEFFAKDNLAVDRLGRPLPASGRYTMSAAQLLPTAATLPAGLTVLPAAAVQDAVIATAGARPWDRDPVDRRIVADTIEGRGRIIDSEQEVGGYPKQTETRAPFDPQAWKLDGVTPVPAR